MSLAAGAVPDLSVDLAPHRPGGLRLRHPVVVAAGGAGFATELLQAVDGALPAAIVTRGTTRLSRRGARPPRMALLEDGLLSAIGYPDAGLEAVLRRHAPRWAASDVPIIVSVAADTAEDIAWAAATLDGRPEVAGMELDLSVPERGARDRPIGGSVETTEIAVVAARAATELPIIVKLPTSVADMREIARAAAAAGADAISAVAPPAAFALDRSRGGSALGGRSGWLSGPAIRTLALRAVHQIAGAVRVPVLGVGGISTLDDVLDQLAAGASAVGLATAALADPWLPGRLGQELESWCAQRGIGSMAELVGSAQPRPRKRARSGPGNRMGPDRRHTL